MPGAAAKSCHRCGGELSASDLVCPQCGLKQYRQCSCGQAYPSSLPACPECGSEWESSIRIRRRSRSEKLRPRQLVRNALLGATIAILASGLLNLIIIALAQRATPEGNVPAALGERLYYAWHTLSFSVVKLFTSLLGGLGYSILIALGGAAAGVIVYLFPTVVSRAGRKTRSDRTRRRRSHR